ncbi:MAG: class I SAM-dependent methyltransferase [Halobacteriota archaeon]
MHHTYHNEAERRGWQNPEQILTEAGVKAGDVFIDLGCGFGFFALPAAKISGSEGLVCGVDIDSEALEELRAQSARAGLGNVRVTLAAAEDVFLCERCADIVFIGIALHDFKDPFKVLQNAKRTLKKDGRLINLDWKKEPTPFGPPVNIRFSEEEATSLIERAGFHVVSIKDSGQYHYVIAANLLS